MTTRYVCLARLVAATNEHCIQTGVV